MKKLLFLLTAVAGITVANAQKIQEKSIPEPVKSGLQKRFPDVKNVKWEKEGGNYEAGFKQQGTNYSVLLTSAGDIIETEVGMAADALAAPIKDYVAKNYPGQKIKEAAKITDEKGMVTYEAEVKGKDLIFDDAGKFIKEQKD